MLIERLVVVTRRTRLEELLLRYNTRGQARFYLEREGADFGPYDEEHDAYRHSLDRVRAWADRGVPKQLIDRSLVPTFDFRPGDVVITVGQDGLVANVAKYATGLPLIAVNPDPERFDGLLLPFTPAELGRVLDAVAADRARLREVTLAEAVLRNGQRLLAFNDLFIGARSHVSARYQIGVAGRRESQSSSGVLVSTGAGSTGWMSSVFNMARGVAALTGGRAGDALRLGWEDERLLYAVREPFQSRSSEVGIVAGVIDPGEAMTVESRMAANGVIFSDGMEEDYLPFDAGAIAEIRTAERRALLVAPVAGA